MDSLNTFPAHPNDQLSKELRDRLLAYPNVTDAGIGLRMKNGGFTSERVIVVYVTKKIPANELPEAALLPKKLEGLPIDVQEELDPSQIILDQGEGLDLTRIRPLRSGITISTSSASDRGGTLGCFAARNGDQKKVLVSNYHVLFRNRGMPGMDDGENKVYQPLEGEHNQIAVVPEGTGSIGGPLDCAVAVLGEEGSCMCCTHTIPHENKTGSTQLVGVASAQVDQKVFKTGAKTGPTVGKVVNVSKAIDGAVDYSDYFLPAGDSFTFTNLIMIVFWDEAADDFDPTQPFTEGGDSGAIVYNESNEIIGLHFSSHFNPATGRHFSFACHIELVETGLGVTIPGTRNLAGITPGPLPPALAALDDPAAASDIIITSTPVSGQSDLQRWWQQVEPQVSRIETGDSFLALVRLHGYEIMRLVNHNREAVMTWQRGKGPAFIAAIARSIRHEDYQIPRVIEGMSAADLASKMAAVLMKHGSAELKEATQIYLPWFLQMIDKLESARDLVSVIVEIDSAQALHISGG
jgi:hypothetical protein